MRSLNAKHVMQGKDKLHDMHGRAQLPPPPAQPHSQHGKVQGKQQHQAGKHSSIIDDSIKGRGKASQLTETGNGKIFNRFDFAMQSWISSAKKWRRRSKFETRGGDGSQNIN
jgi:hypothetical protein